MSKRNQPHDHYGTAQREPARAAAPEIDGQLTLDDYATGTGTDPAAARADDGRA